MRVVISQSMYFPWPGFLDQMRLADIFVHYNDVPFSKGSFTNRVQVKSSRGASWMTIPLHNLHLGQHIDQVEVHRKQDWRSKHRRLLAESYASAPFANDMCALVDEVFAEATHYLVDTSISSMMRLADYFGLTKKLIVLNSKGMGIDGSGSQRVLNIVKAVGGTEYITGHGARNYLDHEEFERCGISVKYMSYARAPYPQQHGAFTPYVSGLDLVANCGREGVQFLRSQTIDWAKFVVALDSGVTH